MEREIEDVSPTSIILQGNGNTSSFSNSQLDGILLVDIRGTGDNTLNLNANLIRNAFGNGEIMVLSDTGDDVVFDDEWKFEEAFVENGQLVRHFINTMQPVDNNAHLMLVGSGDFSNPMNRFDVNGVGGVTALDALNVINELGPQDKDKTRGQRVKRSQ